MKGERVAAVRKRLGLTQVHLAEILGVHPITVSQWERGTAVPNAWASGLLDVFETVQEPSCTGRRAASLLYSSGRPRALYELLRRSIVAARVEDDTKARVEVKVGRP